MDAPWIAQLSEWYLRHARKLPWRKTRDPYRIWISEVMLQQTQVTTVIPYYEKFIGRFPTVEALAAAEESTVLTYWSGLGYYSRAKNLHRGAKTIVERFGGKFPRDREVILEIPGIGPYTAGAILSIAFDLPVPLVDGNVQRVFARLFGVRKSLQLGEVQKFFWKMAGESVSECESPRVFNQALMELGAVVCVKGAPRCLLCPIQASCVALEKGWQLELPLKKVRKEKVDLRWLGLVAQSQGRIFLRQNAKGQWWSDLWDFPRIELTADHEVDTEASRWAGRHRANSFKALTAQRHTVTHHRIHLTPVVFSLKRPIPLADTEGRWFTFEEVRELPLSSLAKKVTQLLAMLE
jgi:A/G-specific adenine glycosylase